MKYKVGDRVKYESSNMWMIWEILSIENDYCRSICVEVVGNSGWRIGEICSWYFREISDYWTYLGNYSKSNNFEELYNLLND